MAFVLCMIAKQFPQVREFDIYWVSVSGHCQMSMTQGQIMTNSTVSATVLMSKSHVVTIWKAFF